jgi:hypothetical protein
LVSTNQWWRQLKQLCGKEELETRIVQISKTIQGNSTHKYRLHSFSTIIWPFSICDGDHASLFVCNSIRIWFISWYKFIFLSICLF